METRQLTLTEEWPPRGEEFFHRLTGDSCPPRDAGISLHLREKEAEAQRGQVTCRGTHSNEGEAHISNQASLTPGVPRGIMGVPTLAVP